jgi:hypothetical protein
LATKVPTKELSELVKNSDHIFQVTIMKIDMTDGKGNIITNPDERTGPGLENTIRLHAKIQENGVLKTNIDKAPKIVIVDLWQMWHYTLGQVQESSINQEVIFLLKGDSFEPVYPAHFQRALSESAEIVSLMK